MRGMWTLTFWRDAAERAISTAAQTAIGVLAVDQLGLLDAPWLAVGSAAGLAAVVSLLKAVAASRVGDPTSASLVRADVPPAG